MNTLNWISVKAFWFAFVNSSLLGSFHSFPKRFDFKKNLKDQISTSNMKLDSLCSSILGSVGYKYFPLKKCIKQFPCACWLRKYCIGSIYNLSGNNSQLFYLNFLFYECHRVQMKIVIMKSKEKSSMVMVKNVSMNIPNSILHNWLV